MSQFTRNAIRESFLRLLEERPVSHITVKDIVADCGINRNTFYYHYQDLPALVEEIVMDAADRLIASCEKVSTMEEGLRIAVDSIRQHQKTVLHLCAPSSRHLFEQYLWRICEHVAGAFLDSVLADKDISDSDRQILLRFYKCECFGQLIDWLDGGMRTDIMSSFHRLCELKRSLDADLFYRNIL